MARSASKRVGRFSRQRMQRLMRGGESGGDDNGSDDGGNDPRPFVDIAVEHATGKAAASGGDGGGNGRGRGAKRGAARALLESYVAAFGLALDLELEEEWQEAEQRLQSWSRERLAAEGVALFQMSAAADGQIYRDSVLKFFRPNEPLPFHALSQASARACAHTRMPALGDIILISRGDPGGDSLEGVVVDYSTRWLRVALPTQVAEHVRGPGWRLDLYANTIAHERAQAALKCFAAPALGGGGGGGGGDSGGGGAVAADAEADGRKWAGPGQPGEGLWRALSGCLTAGKTRTLLRLCRAALPLLPGGGQLLAVAASNVAVDNLVGGLLDLGVKVVRVGQPVKVGWGT
ncbi:hypothetical protein MNEG_14377 [Monoraphidium neglectum]|uniref:Uncharacterized protein n=1 Tax=Monoraphidium neglectum TaxID=145388 RepID=A0A0D2MEK2_9CHLO|nr:hypothetical protein MNEG_14377 [Monoraphidium neglectum]KIY93585.1 hypothetical protein MNEG_14377 [Monoraphidium neglectum]|eukprot:XP_013892605.1 hypothetical protein MNEG_14377 [Monoraphidium neglectum]